MISTIQDLLVNTDEDFDRLPAEGLFEVVDGRAILLPPNDYEHQDLSDALVGIFRHKLRALGYGYAVSTVNVRIPPKPGALSPFQNRVPGIVVSKHKPKRRDERSECKPDAKRKRDSAQPQGRAQPSRFELGEPPELVIEILATPRGNVERTEKMDDYARAGIGEYWIVDPFARKFEVYLSRAGEYMPAEESPLLRPVAFLGLEIDPQEIWAVFDVSSK